MPSLHVLLCKTFPDKFCSSNHTLVPSNRCWKQRQPHPRKLGQKSETIVHRAHLPSDDSSTYLPISKWLGKYVAPIYLTNFHQHNMMSFPNHGEFLQKGGRRRCSVRQEKPWLLHINGHRSGSERNRRGHN